MPRLFRDRTHAGRSLAAALIRYARRPDVLVLGLPRGGVEVAAEVAGALSAELDVMLVRKLGVPGHEELAFGALGPDGTRVLNPDVIAMLRIRDDVLDAVARREAAELDRRNALYRAGRPAPAFEGRTVILVDDGLATGATMRAAVAAVRSRRPGRIVVAVPVAPPDTVRQLAREVDEVVCLHSPANFGGVGQWYDDFEQTPDERVVELLTAASRPPGP